MTGDWAFSQERRVEFGELDAMGHVNNVVFLRYFETGRIAFLREVAPDHDPANPDDFGVIFAECHINYRSPGQYEDVIVTRIRPGWVRRSAFQVEFRMEREDGTLLTEGYGVLVGYDYSGGRSTPLPAALRERLVELGGVEDAESPVG